MGRLTDRVAIVTGSGRGIGRATALRFAEEGAAVVVNDVDPDPAEETAEEIRKNGGQAAIAVPAQVRRVVHSVGVGDCFGTKPLEATDRDLLEEPLDGVPFLIRVKL